jgi:hypothetical protein
MEHNRLVNLLMAAKDDAEKFKWVIENLDKENEKDVLYDLFYRSRVDLPFEISKMAFELYPSVCKKFIYCHPYEAMFNACRSGNLEFAKLMWQVDPKIKELETIFKTILGFGENSVDVLKWMWGILKPTVTIDAKKIFKNNRALSWDVIVFLVDISRE